MNGEFVAVVIYVHRIGSMRVGRGTNVLMVFMPLILARLWNIYTASSSLSRYKLKLAINIG